MGERRRMIKLIIKRIWKRFKYAFQWKELLTWEYESCDNCGHCFKVCWDAEDGIWIFVNGAENGCLCIDCFVEKAKKQGFMIDQSHINRMEIFNPMEE